MRQLFLPACVCLVTWSGATNSDPRFSLDEYSTRQTTEQKSTSQRFSGDTTPAETTSELFAAIDPEPVARKAAAGTQANLPAADVLSALAIEPPVPSGVVVNNGEPTGVPLPPIPKPVVARSTEEVCETLTQSARNNDLPAPFFIRLLFRESRFDPAVVSPAGAQGVAQFMPETAADMGLENPFDPVQAIPASARLLRNLIQQFGNLGLAAAAYNAGPKRIADWLANKGKSKLPEETQGYVKNITGRAVENWSVTNARHPAPKLPRRAPCQEAAGLLAWNGPDIVPMPSPSPLRLAANKPAKPAEANPAGKNTAEKKVAEKKAATMPTKKSATVIVASAAQPPAHQAKAAAHKSSHKKTERIAQR